MSRVATRPLQVSSQTAQRWPVSGSNSRSITAGNPLAIVATRVNPPPVVERVGVDGAVGLEADEEQAVAVVRIVRRVVGGAGALVEEAARGQERVRDPGDRLEARCSRATAGRSAVRFHSCVAVQLVAVAAGRSAALGPADAARRVVALGRHVEPPAGRAAASRLRRRRRRCRPGSAAPCRRPSRGRGRRPLGAVPDPGGRACRDRSSPPRAHRASRRRMPGRPGRSGCRRTRWRRRRWLTAAPPGQAEAGVWPAQALAAPLVGSRSCGERAGAVGAAAVGRGRVGGPAVGVDQRHAVGGEQAGRVGAAEAEHRARRRRPGSPPAPMVVPAGERERVGVVVVLDDPAGHVDGASCRC